MSIFIMTMVNTFISFIVSDVLMIQLISCGVNKYLALGVGLFSALVIYFYVVYNHKMRNKIS
jgi:nicotinamide riboside transporter PnuC